MGCRAKCDRCNKRRWSRIVAGRRVCSECIAARVEKKSSTAAKVQGGRPWRRY